MKSIKYNVLVICAVLMGLMGNAERPSGRGAGDVKQPEELRGRHERGTGSFRAKNVGSGQRSFVEGDRGGHQTKRVRNDEKFPRRDRDWKKFYRRDRDGKQFHDRDRDRGRFHHRDRSWRRGHRFDRRHSHDERRGRQWYRSFRTRFFEPGFVWPRAYVFNTFFTDIVPELEGYGIPQEAYQALLRQIQQLQSMLAQQGQDAALNEDLRHRLVTVMGKLVELAPGVDVQGLFEGAGQPQPGPDGGQAGPDGGQAGPDDGQGGPDAGQAGPDAGQAQPEAG